MIVRANSVQERRVLAIRPAPLSVGMFAWLFLFPVSGRRFFRSFDGPERDGSVSWQGAGASNVQLDDRDARSAHFLVLVFRAADERYGPQVAAYLLLQRAGSLAVQDADFGEPEHDRLVDEVLHRFDRLGYAHAAHVDLFVKLEPPLGRSPPRRRPAP